MFTKEQVEYWKSIGIDVSDWEQMAVSSSKKSIDVRINDIIKGENEDLTILFSVYSNSLINEFATTMLIGKSPKKFQVISAMRDRISNNTMDWKLTVSLSSLLEYSDGIYLNVECNKLVAESETKNFFTEALFPKQQKKCYCDRDLTAAEWEAIIVALRKKDMSGITRARRDPNSRKKQKDGDFILDASGNKIFDELSFYDAPYGADKKPLKNRIFFLGDEKIAEREANFTVLARELNKCFRDYKINSCIRKICFLGQAYVETQMLTKSYESNPSGSVSGGDFYRGRGLIQLTNDYNYRKFYKVGSNKEPSDEELKKFVPLVAKHMELACQGSAWYWGDVNANKYADIDNVDLVSAAINRPKALRDATEIDNISQLSARTKYTSLFKDVMNYENCRKK